MATKVLSNEFMLSIETDEIWKTLCCKASIEGLCQDELISDNI